MTRTAKAGADDLILMLRKSPENADWLLTLTVELDDTMPETQQGLLGKAVEEGAITDDQRTRLLNISRSLRDWLLTKAGFTQSP